MESWVVQKRQKGSTVREAPKMLTRSVSNEQFYQGGVECPAHHAQRACLAGVRAHRRT